MVGPLHIYVNAYQQTNQPKRVVLETPSRARGESCAVRTPARTTLRCMDPEANHDQADMS